MDVNFNVASCNLRFRICIGSLRDNHCDAELKVAINVASRASATKRSEARKILPRHFRTDQSYASSNSQ